MAALDDETGYDPVERDAVVDAGVDEPEEVADVVRGAVRIHVDRDTAVGGVEHRPVGGQLRVGLGGERRNLGRRLVANRHPVHDDALGGAPLGVDRGLGDPRDDVHAVGDLAPDGMLAVEPRLIDDADEELRSAAPRLSGHDHRRDRAPHVPGSAELGVDQPETAPAVIRGPLRIARERVAALDDAVAHHAMERRAVEMALPGELHHQPDVIGCKIGAEIDGDCTEIGLENRLLAAHLLERERGDERFAGLRGQRRNRRRQPDQQCEHCTRFHLHTSPARLAPIQ